MDNIKLVTILSDYGIFCLERQKQVLATYRKMRREYWELAIVIILAIAAIGCAIGSVVCAMMELFDGWASALVFILDGICAAMFGIYAKVTVDHINEAKAFIAKASDVTTTLDDIVYLANSMEEDDEQC